jgi:DNA uptake protein ComE-like DNA-binding protein
MNRFFEFSQTQIKVLTVLAVIIIVGGAYKLMRDYYHRSAEPVHAWRVETLDQYQPPFVLDLNLSPVDSLELAPGIGPTLAARIDEYRRTRGGFAAVDSLVGVPGIGPATLEKVRRYFKVTTR